MSTPGLFAPVRPQARRSWMWLGGVIFVALLIFMPLRLALGLAGTGAGGLTARSAGGTVWSGRLIDARIGSIDVGTIDTSLRPLPLLLGRLRFDGERTGGAPLAGSAETGWGRRAIHELTGTLSGGRIGDVPIEQVTMDALTVIFSGGRCAEASGRVRIVLGFDIAGVALRNGLSGVARCDNGALLLPLTGDSGVERLVLRITGDGRYSGTLGTGAVTQAMRIEGQF